MPEFNIGFPFMLSQKFMVIMKTTNRCDIETRPHTLVLFQVEVKQPHHCSFPNESMLFRKLEAERVNLLEC